MLAVVLAVRDAADAKVAGAGKTVFAAGAKAGVVSGWHDCQVSRVTAQAVGLPS